MCRSAFLVPLPAVPLPAVPQAAVPQAGVLAGVLVGVLVGAKTFGRPSWSRAAVRAQEVSAGRGSF
ncbi:hypothetical protein ABT158_12680 [Nonomuraea sp. NPDC001636]|uniref:hypothetical protein n=1 Tax=Nonomuraea sp. NPDC001636 TaxID=3154391 RepID=UPI003318E7F7